MFATGFLKARNSGIWIIIIFDILGPHHPVLRNYSYICAQGSFYAGPKVPSGVVGTECWLAGRVQGNCPANYILSTYNLFN